MNPTARLWAHVPGVTYPPRNVSAEPPRCKNGKRPTPKPITKKRRALVVKTYNSMQHSIKEMSRTLCISDKTIRRILIEEGVAIRPTGVRLDCHKRKGQSK